MEELQAIKMNGGREVGWAAAIGAGLGVLAVLAGLLSPVLSQSPQLVNVTSNVTIFAQIELVANSSLITPSTISFGNITKTGTSDIPAKNNTGLSGGTLLGIGVRDGNSSQYVNVTPNTNVNVTACVAGNNSLKLPGQNIYINSTTNYTWNVTARHANGTWWTPNGSNATSPGSLFPINDNNLALPDLNAGGSYRTQTGISYITPGTDNATIFFSFFLDIPSFQEPGDYSNIVSLKVVRQTVGC